MNLYIINLIWSRQCWRPASSVSGGIPAVSSSAQGNWISACIKKKYSEGFRILPLSFSLCTIKATAWDSYASARPGAAHSSLYLLLTKWLCHFLSHKDPAPTAHPFKVFLDGLCKDGWSLSDQQEMHRFCSQWTIGQHTSQSTGMDTKGNYCTQ